MIAAAFWLGQLEAWARAIPATRDQGVGAVAADLFFALQLALAVAATIFGVLTQVGWIEARTPWLHRWLVRAFLFITVAAGFAGFYLAWATGSHMDIPAALASGLTVVLATAFGILAWRAMLRGAMAERRRWATRAYLTANAVWLTRVGLSGWITLDRHAPRATDLVGSFMDFGCYLLPLAVFEFYLWASTAKARSRGHKNGAARSAAPSSQGNWSI